MINDFNLQGIVDVVLDDNSIRAVPRPGTSLRLFARAMIELGTISLFLYLLYDFR